MEPDGNLSWQLILLIVLVFTNAFFSMSEIAIISLNDNKMRKLAQEGDKKAMQLVRLIDQPSRFLATIQVGITLSGFMASALAADTFALRLIRVFRTVPVSATLIRVAALILITLALSFVNLVFGELVPKRIGMHYYERVAMAVAGPISFLAKLERPFVVLLSGATNLILRLLGIDPKQRPEQVTEEEIRMMIDVGNESGSIEKGDKDMINNIFELDDRTAEEMMTHRTEIEAIELGTPLDEIVGLAVETGYSRIPVYEDDLDSIVGILYVKDLLDRVTKEPDAPFNLADYMRKPLYVIESATGKALLGQFQAEKIQMAVVVDEYGGTSGIITMEDLLESIVGSIQDEYDDEDEEIVSVGDNCYLIDGLASLEMVAKLFSLEIDEEDEEEFDTIGGYIVQQLGYIPGEEERPQIEIGNILFSVYAMDERRIDKLKAELLSPEMQTDFDGQEHLETH